MIGFMALTKPKYNGQIIGLFQFVENFKDLLNPSNAFNNTNNIKFTTIGGYRTAGPFNAGAVSNTALFNTYVEGKSRWAMSLDVYFATIDTNHFIFNSNVWYAGEKYQSLNTSSNSYFQHGFVHNGAGSRVDSPAGIIPTGQWMNLTTMGGLNGNRIYLNRVLIASNINTAYYSFDANPTQFDIGAHSFFGNALAVKGYIKNVRFFNNVTSISDVTP